MSRAERLYQQAVTDPAVDSLDQHAVARYIRQEADKLYLDWRKVLQEIGDLHPWTTHFKKASDIRGEDYTVSLK